jgi:hypothetical protein
MRARGRGIRDRLFEVLLIGRIVGSKSILPPGRMGPTGSEGM